MSTTPRNRNLARIHTATKAVGLEGDKYKEWLKKRTGKESCKDLTDEQLSDLVEWLRPTDAQWWKVKALIREIGLTGFADEGYKTFVRRVTKEDNPALLSRLQVHNLIAGLVRWADHRRQADPVSPPVTPDPAGAPLGGEEELLDPLGQEDAAGHQTDEQHRSRRLRPHELAQ